MIKKKTLQNSSFGKRFITFVNIFLMKPCYLMNFNNISAVLLCIFLHSVNVFIIFFKNVKYINLFFTNIINSVILSIMIIIFLKKSLLVCLKSLKYFIFVPTSYFLSKNICKFVNVS